MRKGMWSTAAFVTLVTGTVVFGGPSSQAAGNRVAMGSSDEPLKFLPAEISVPVGTKVEWFNETEVQHDVSAEDGSFDSKGLLGKGQNYEFTFTKPGEFKYFCTPHKDAGMKGVVKVTSAGTSGTPTTAAASPTTQSTTAPATTAPGQGAPTPVTARAAAGTSTTTTTRAGSSSGPSSTTTTTAGGAGVTSTTQAPSVTPTSAPDTAGETSTTTAVGHPGEESAATDHASEGGSENPKKKNSPIGMAFASVSTVLLAAIAGKLLASKP